MDYSYNYNYNLSGLSSAWIVVSLLFGLAGYIYNALVWMTIAKKLGHKYPWLAWIPIGQTILQLQLAGLHWAWIFLLLALIVPLLNILILFGIIALMVIIHWRVFQKRNYPPALSLITLGTIIPFLNFVAGIAYLVIMGMVAWKDRTPVKSSTAAPAASTTPEKKPETPKK
jgi:hypothetical protein